MDRPTVLLVGTGERMKAALEDALERHQMMVESVRTERAVEAAFAAAPDLLVLIGDAAIDGGRVVLARLSASPATSTVPVVLLTDEAGLDRRLDAFRHGVVAVVPKSASADGMARRIAEVARELPEREGETAGELGEATVDELVELFSQQLRTGILSVSADGSDEASAQIVLRAGRPVAEAIEELVTRLRPLVSAGGASSLRYEFHESTSARLTLLEGEDAEPEDAALLQGRRILLIEQNPARADILVQELRARGALVVVADGEGAGLDRARAMDPEVVILDGSGVQGWALASLRALRRDPRLRWASLLVVDAKDLWPSAGGGPDLERLASSLELLVRADRELGERASRETSFDTRLEIIGPSRMLRALTGTGLGLRVAVQHPRARVEVDLAEGIVAGALATRAGKSLAEGPQALATLLALSSGRVHVERKEAPASANVMAPLDDALAAATREVPPIKPSIPPPSGRSEPPPSGAPKRQGDAERLIGRLEDLLERLQKVLPEEPLTPPRPAVQPPVKPIPPPRRPLSGARRKTLALGSVPAIEPPPVRYESQDDLPVIVGVAEPSASAPDPVAEPPPSTPEPSPGAAPALEPAPPGAPPEGSASPLPLEAAESSASPDEGASPNERAASESPFEPAARIAEPEEDAAQPRTALGADAALSSEAAPSEPPASSPLPLSPQEPPRSRGLLVFGLAFASVFILAGGGAAYLHVSGKPPFAERPTPTLAARSDAPPTSEPNESTKPEETESAKAEEETESALASLEDALPLDSGLPDALVAEAEDGGISDSGALDAGAPDAGAPDVGSPEAGASGSEAEALASADDEDEDETEEARNVDPLAHAIRSGNYHRNRGNLRAAEASYMRALRLDANNPRAMAGLARLNMARGNSSAAVRWSRRLVDARPQNAANHVLLGDALQRAGQRRAAVQSWQRALELSPGLRSARQRLER